jgi:hypothetical protein
MGMVPASPAAIGCGGIHTRLDLLLNRPVIQSSLNGH